MPYDSALPGHVEWLVLHRGGDLTATLSGQGLALDVRDALRVLMAADPSPRFHAVQWLCDTLLAGGMRWEDVQAGAESRVHHTLAAFAMHRRHLPRGQQNLSGYSSLASLNRALAPLIAVAEQTEQAHAPPTGRELRRQARQQAYDSSLVLHESPELIIAVPMTRMAACWWGRGTQWCTAAESNNMFEHYHKSAPLVVVVLPGVEQGKMQLHMDPDGELQFMDVHDGDVEPEFLHMHWSKLAPLAAWAARINGRIVFHTRGLELEQSVYADAVASYGGALAHVPKHMLSAQMCRTAVLANPSMLWVVPLEYMTQSLLEDVMDAHPYALSYVPLELRSRDLCVRTVSRNGSAIHSVPNEFLNQGFHILAVQSDGRVLAIIPESSRTPDLCQAAVMRHANALRYVPMHMRTRELCTVAALGGFLHFADKPEYSKHLSEAFLTPPPQHLLDSEVYSKAIEIDPRQLEYVPVHLRTTRLCTQAVQGNSMALRCVPDIICTDELRMMAIQGDGEAIIHVPAEHRTWELKVAAIKRSPKALAHLKTDCTPELCTIAVRNHPESIVWTPKHLQTPELCAIAAQHDDFNLAHIPESMRTHEICVKACMRNASAYSNVDPQMRHAVMAAVNAARPPPDNQAVAHDWDETTYFADLMPRLANCHGAAPSRDLPAQSSP